MRFRLLGPVEITGHEAVFTAPRPRSRAVLAYLLLSANRLVTTAAIVDAIWGQAPPTTARNQIQADVSAVRTGLAPSRVSRMPFHFIIGVQDPSRPRRDRPDGVRRPAGAREPACRPRRPGRGGQLAEAAELLRHSLALNIQSGRLEGLSVNLGNLSIACMEIGDYDLAERYFHDAFVLYRKFGSHTAEATLLSNLAGLELGRRSVEQAQKAKHRFVETRALIGLSRIHLRLNDSTSALDTARPALSLASSAGYAAFGGGPHDRRYAGVCFTR
jgi:tetratricopeptide (TPR) repeat protein